MRAPVALFNQSLSLCTRSGYDAYGRETVGSATTVACRFQKMTKTVIMPSGDTIIITGIAYVPATTSIQTNDKVTFASDNYRVHNVYSAINRSGSTNHKKLELVSWQI